MKGFYNKRTLLSFSGAIVMALSLFLFITACIHYGFTNLIAHTKISKEAIICCGTVFSWCLVDFAMLKTVFPLVGLGIITSGLINATIKAVRSLMISRRFLKNIKTISPIQFPLLNVFLTKDSKTDIILFQDSFLKTAFTIGLLRPKIYISTGLIKELLEEEINAIIVHEQHHVHNKDPLRLFIISFIKDTFFFLPLGHYLKEVFYMTKELAADKNVVTVTRKPVNLASVLLKMIKMERRSLPVGVPILDSGRLVEKRITEILNPDPKKNKVPWRAVILTSIGIIILLIAFGLPIYSEAKQMKKCNPSYCQMTCSNHFKHDKKSCECD